MEISIEPLLNLQQDVRNSIVMAHAHFKRAVIERITQAYVETRLEYLEDQWKLFTETHRTIVTDIGIADYHNSSYYIDRLYETTLELYCEFKTELKEMLHNIFEKRLAAGSNKEHVQGLCPSDGVAAVAQVKLPKITIPNFSGKYTEWTSFKELFVSLIHNNPNLSNVQKHHFLKAHLVGEAELLLRHVPVNDANYMESWALLSKRFSNKKYLTYCLLNRMINQSNISGDSSTAVKDLLDTTRDCLNGLRHQGINIDSWDAIVIYIVSSKLDFESRKLWEAQISASDDHPTIHQFIEFLENRFRSLEFLLLPRLDKTTITQVNVHNSVSVCCPFCSGNHKLYRCRSFANEGIDTRRSFVRTNNLCYNCMSLGHSVFVCRLSSRCQICSKKHHTLLHASASDPIECNVKDSSMAKVNNVVASHSTTFSQVLLPTALIKIESQLGSSLTYRSLLDQGSQMSFITESAVQSLGLVKVPCKTLIAGVGDQVESIVSESVVTLHVKSISSPEFTIPVKAHVMNNITSVTPSLSINIHKYPMLANLSLADPEAHICNRIDLLLGSDIFSQIIMDGLIKGPPGTLVAQNTKLGWILSGQVQDMDNSLKGLRRDYTTTRSYRKNGRRSIWNQLSNTVH